MNTDPVTKNLAENLNQEESTDMVDESARAKALESELNKERARSKQLESDLDQERKKVVIREARIKELEVDLDAERLTIGIRDERISALEGELKKKGKQENELRAYCQELEVKLGDLGMSDCLLQAAWQAVASTLDEETMCLVEQNIDHHLFLLLMVALAKKVKSLNKDLTAAHEQEAAYRERIRMLLANQHGTSSERAERLRVQQKQQGQLDFEDQMGPSASVDDPAEDELATRKAVVKGHVRWIRSPKKAECVSRLPEDTEQHVIVHDVAEEQQTCPVCGGAMHHVGYREVDEVRLNPLSVELDRHLLEVVGCRWCEQHGTQVPMITANGPAKALPGSWAAPETLSWVLVQKYEMALSYYRIEEALQSAGVWIPRSTLSGWPIQLAGRWLGPLVSYMHRIILAQDVVHADETTWQCLREPDRRPTQKSYLWSLLSGPCEEEQLIVFQYEPGRSKDEAKEVVGGFENSLLTDGYKAYHAAAPKATIAMCWAHARRKWEQAFEALKPKDKKLVYHVDTKAFVVTSVPEDNEKAEPTPVLGRLADSLIGFAFCNELYAVEDLAKEKTPEERKELRQKMSKPILSRFQSWFTPRVTRDQKGKPTGTDCVSKAINYLENNWDALQAFLKDGCIPIDNNRLESLIRDIALVRKNSLFSVSQAGASATATIASVVESAKLAGLDPFRYLTWLLREMPKTAQELVQAGKIKKADANNFDDATLKRFLPSQAPDSVRRPLLSEITPLEIGSVTDMLISADCLCELIHTMRTGNGVNNETIQQFDEAVTAFRKSALVHMETNASIETQQSSA